MVTSRKSRKFADVVRLGWKQALWQALLFLLIGGIAWLKSSQRQNCPAAGCWTEPLHQSLPARPGSRRKLPASQGNRGYLGGNRAQEFLTTSFLAFFGIFRAENAKNDVVRNLNRKAASKSGTGKSLFQATLQKLAQKRKTRPAVLLQEFRHSTGAPKLKLFIWKKSTIGPNHIYNIIYIIK